MAAMTSWLFGATNDTKAAQEKVLIRQGIDIILAAHKSYLVAQEVLREKVRDETILNLKDLLPAQNKSEVTVNVPAKPDEKASAKPEEKASAKPEEKAKENNHSGKEIAVPQKTWKVKDWILVGVPAIKACILAIRKQSDGTTIYDVLYDGGQTSCELHATAPLRPVPEDYVSFAKRSPLKYGQTEARQSALIDLMIKHFDLIALRPLMNTLVALAGKTLGVGQYIYVRDETLESFRMLKRHAIKEIVHGFDISDIVLTRDSVAPDKSALTLPLVQHIGWTCGDCEITHYPSFANIFGTATEDEAILKAFHAITWHTAVHDIVLLIQ